MRFSIPSRSFRLDLGHVVVDESLDFHSQIRSLAQFLSHHVPCVARPNEQNPFDHSVPPASQVLPMR